MTPRWTGLLLDIDDTLLDTTRAMITAGTTAMKAVWPQQPDDWCVRASERFRADPGGYFARFTRGDLAFDDMRAARLAEVASAYNLPVPDAAHATYEAAFRPAFNAAQHVYDDVQPLLRRCAQREVVVGAVTNSSESATADKLAVTGLGEQLVTVVTRDTLGFGKPDPRIFAYACQQLGLSTDQVLFVGDELAADVVGAQDAGLTAYWLRRPADVVSRHAPDRAAGPSEARVISSLNEIELS
ncbi:HAD family hydrolase [Luteipulveratus mongoliensis]|uniref:HAD family hydrolase n=1 Tax=Luteipulveratus mongoliensis TaxID=571913 RepID=UPI00069722D4|nr:HAD family hydrolase [Luteipulveratus mongoliensis]